MISQDGPAPSLICPGLQSTNRPLPLWPILWGSCFCPLHFHLSVGKILGHGPLCCSPGPQLRSEGTEVPPKVARRCPRLKGSPPGQGEHHVSSCHLQRTQIYLPLLGYQVGPPSWLWGQLPEDTLRSAADPHTPLPPQCWLPRGCFRVSALGPHSGKQAKSTNGQSCRWAQSQLQIHLQAGSEPFTKI